MSINDYSLKHICLVYLHKTSFFLPHIFSHGYWRFSFLKLKCCLCFKIKRLSKIIWFLLMHFLFALDLSNIDLWNKDLLDTNLDLLDTDVLSKHCLSPRRLHVVYKTCLQEVLKNYADDNTPRITNKHL